MVTENWVNFFLGSTGASAALIGLLFVAVAVAPERVFGHEATAKRRMLAGSAFTALLNGFFISLVALTPQTSIGSVTMIMGLIGLVNTLSLGRYFWEERRRGVDIESVTLMLGSMVIYGLEIWFGAQVLQQPTAPHGVERVVNVLIATYALGVDRAWAVLGGQDEGLLSLLGFRRTRAAKRSDSHTSGDKPT